VSSLSQGGSGSENRSPRASWLSAASRREILSAALVCGAATLLITAGIQFLLVLLGCQVRIVLWVSAAIAGVFASLLAFGSMQHARQRRQLAAERLQIVATLNHRIRNSLELIQLIAHMTHNADTIEQLAGAVEHIQRSLREVLEQPRERNRK